MRILIFYCIFLACAGCTSSQVKDSVGFAAMGSSYFDLKRELTRPSKEAVAELEKISDQDAINYRSCVGRESSYFASSNAPASEAATAAVAKCFPAKAKFEESLSNYIGALSNSRPNSTEVKSKIEKLFSETDKIIYQKAVSLIVENRMKP